MKNRILKWWKTWRAIRFSPMSDMVIAPSTMAIESTREVSARKRVRKQIESQHSQMMARALKSHQCQEPMFCEKEPCFERIPDVIADIKEIPYDRKKRTKKDL